MGSFGKMMDFCLNQKDAERNSLQYDVLNKPPSFIWTPFVKKTHFGKNMQNCGKVAKVGDDDDGGIILPGHPGPIPNAPRDNISRKGIASLRLVPRINRNPHKLRGYMIAHEWYL